MNQEIELTIGLPIFNEEKKIGKVLEDLFSQNYRNFYLIISDNASEDNSYQICNEWAKKNKNIELVRQKKKLNINENFYFIYSKVKTKYFMWIAADDNRSQDYISKNIEFLNNNLDYIASSSKNIVELKDNKKTEVTFDINGTMSERYLKFLQNCFFSHGIFYSIFRTINLEETKKYLNYIAWDWIVNLTIIKNGKFKRISEGYFISAHGGTSTKKDYIYNQNSKLLFKLFPFHRFMIKFFKFYLKSNYSIKGIYFSIIIFFKIHKKYLKIYLLKKFYEKNI